MREREREREREERRKGGGDFGLSSIKKGELF